MYFHVRFAAEGWEGRGREVCGGGKGGGKAGLAVDLLRLRFMGITRWFFKSSV